MKRVSLMCMLGCLAASGSYAQDGKWMLRTRALYIAPQESSTVSIGGKVDLSTRVVPEVDVSYFFTPNIAAELIAATTKHYVKKQGTDLGNVWLLPPTLTLQYHLTQLPYVKPYVGAGINYTHFYNADAGVLDTVRYKDSIGPALQVGVDVPVKDHWYLNFDVKKIWINTDVKFNHGAVTADVDIDPWVVGAGIGYRF